MSLVSKPISFSSVGAVTVVVLNQPMLIDRPSLAEIRAQVHAVIDDASVMKLVFDLSRLELITSAGIELLIEVNRFIRAKQATWCIVNKNPQIEGVFKAAHVTQLLNIRADQKSAIDSLN